MKIYTKTGDKGETSLLGGKRVSKTDIRIESIGVVDELNAWMGLIGDVVSDKKLIKDIRDIQAVLFTIGSHLAIDNTSDSDNLLEKLPKVSEDNISSLEKSIDNIDSELDTLQNFILPGGHTTVSHCHLARAVCRRAERMVIKLSQDIPVNDFVIKYLNRLSDYLFILARKIAKDNNIDEIEWKGL